VSRRTRIALATAAAAVPLVAAAPAGAYFITAYDGGPAVPVGTPFTGTAGGFSFQNAATGATVGTCTGATANGVTGGSSGVSEQLDVTSGTITGCKVGSQNVFVTANASAASPWSVVPRSGTTSPFGGEVQNVNITVRCGTATATPATYAGTITTGGSSQNVVGTPGSGSTITAVQAGPLTKSGSGCPALPSTGSITGTIVLRSVGGVSVSATNNLWLNP
jgi:hypothetical protein